MERKPKAGSEGPITRGGGDDPGIIPTFIDRSFYLIAWLVVHHLAEEALKRSRRRPPQSHGREDMPPSICVAIFDHVREGPDPRSMPPVDNAGGTRGDGMNVPSAVSVQAIVAARGGPAKQPRKTVRRIGETIVDAARSAVALGRTPGEFGHDLGSNGALKADIERLTDEIVKALQDKDRGWTRDEAGRKFRRPPGRALTVFDLANWTYQDRSDESIRAGEIIDLTEAIQDLEPPIKAVFTLYCNGSKPREIAEQIGMDRNQVYRYMEAARAALSRRLKGR